MAAIAAASALPALLTVLRGGDDLTTAVAAGVFGISALPGFALDDPCADLTESTPTPRWHRWGARLAYVGAAGALVVAVLVGLTLLTGAGIHQPTRSLAALGAAVAGLDLAVASHRSTERGLRGAAIAVVTVLFVGVLDQRFPRLPGLTDPSDWPEWLAVGAAGTAVALPAWFPTLSARSGRRASGRGGR